MNKNILLAGAVALALPAAASANEIEWSGEVSANVAHSAGTTETTVYGGIELAYGGAFAGLEIESLYKDPFDNAEITLSFGYTFDLGNDMALTASYARLYLDKSGFASHEAGLALDFPLSGNVGATLEVVRDLTADATDISFGAEFGLYDAVTGWALVGNDGTDNYGELGVYYDVSENVTIGYLLEVAENVQPTHNFGVAYSF